ncbi:hypothetical protein AB834_04395 [PVC group bacterium (ex Bugula neritina AB1)]|nr:hypothetical protein AB834_04395 [PVC group bacterium (ex Bugula neritina AB1)]
MTKVKVGIAGCGIVGIGVVDILQKRFEEFRELYQVELELAVVVVRNIDSDRDIAFDKAILTTDLAMLDNVDIVVELIGGDTVAKDVVLNAIHQKKHVVTANKALVAKHWDILFEAVRGSQVMLKFEAAVAGAVPVIKTIQESLIGNKIEELKGIINGTANYILSEMESRGESLALILKEAQDLGYAEADPTFDIEGFDVAHKLCILASLAYGVKVECEDMYIQGITDLEVKDMAYIRELGYRIKLLAIAKKYEKGLDVRVHPALVPESQILGAVSGPYNAIDIKGHASGDILLYGQGAGRYPTAGAVVGDILDIARCLQKEQPLPFFFSERKKAEFIPIEDIENRYYIRLNVSDQPGVLAKITNIFGEHAIGIASVIQKEVVLEDQVPLVVMTGKAREDNMRRSLDEIEALDTVFGSPTLIRIED